MLKGKLRLKQTTMKGQQLARKKKKTIWNSDRLTDGGRYGKVMTEVY